MEHNGKLILPALLSACLLIAGCGKDGGWIRVFVWPEGDEPGLTGYIWHSYLRDVRP